MATRMSAEQLSPLIQAAAQKYGIPANVIAAVIQRESGGRPTIASGTGPVGLMQVGKGVASDYGYKPEDRLDPAKNIDMGARYLKQNYDAFGGDWQKAMVGYSEGTGGAKQMFAGKRPFTKQAYDSMTNSNFTPFYTKDQNEAITAHQVANPVAALTEHQQQNVFNPNYLNQDQAEAAPTQADTEAQQAGVLSGNQAITPAANSYQEPVVAPDKSQQGWIEAGLGLASALASGKNKKTTQSRSGVGRGSSSYSPQTQAALRLLSSIGTDYYK